MSEVQLRITELREAAALLDRASRRVDDSVQNVQAILDQLAILGFGDLTPKFALEYNQYRPVMDTWAQQLSGIAVRLTEAATELENALTTQYQGTTNTGVAFTPIVMPVRRLGSAAAIPVTVDEQDKYAAAPSPALQEYVAGVNRSLHEELAQNQQMVRVNQVRLGELLEARQSTTEDLEALRNRLASYDGVVDPSINARVQVLEGEIAHYDQEISLVQDRIGGLQGRVGDITARLDRVKPGTGADIQLIAELEGTETAGWIKEHTHGCVNHIVNRMSVPSGISRHAYLWDNAAAQLPQYGITSGNIPLVGSVLVMEQAHEYADDVFGHLLYVERVDNGVVWVTDNLHPDTAVRLSDLTGELSGDNMTYLYFPWNTQA